MVFQPFEPKSFKKQRFFNGFRFGEASLGRPAWLGQPGSATAGLASWLGCPREPKRPSKEVQDFPVGPCKPEETARESHSH